ncbi:MAG: hypothetical protein HYT06_01430 [Candidatus Levybacteria bacterium]|nr:hypothetical protein [Candidatus Levybacteria bacterium]
MENETQPNGQLPIISEETIGRLKEELGIDVSGSTRSVLEGITKERQTSFTEKLEQMTEGVVFDMVEMNPKLAEALGNGIREGYPYANVVNCRTAIIDGMALMIRAFNIESKFDLMQRLSEISDDESIKKVKEVVSKSLGEGKDMDSIERAFKTPKISDVQIAMNKLVREATSNYNGLKIEFNLGASVMYGVLSEFRSKLFPPQSPPQQATSASQPPIS